MKLRIKETDEILEDVKFIDTTLHKITIQYLDDGVLRECVVKNLSDVEEIKDYEERKYDGLHIAIMELADFIQNEPNEDKVDLEDCVKVLRKLEAWKRLKENGISFKVKTIDRKWYLEPKAEPQQRTIAESQDLIMAINTIFGDENKQER